MDFLSRAARTSAESASAGTRITTIPLHRVNSPRNASPPSLAPRFPKCHWVRSGVSLSLAPSRGRGIPWTLPCTTSPGNIDRDTKETRCLSTMRAKTFMIPRIFCVGMGRGGFYDIRNTLYQFRNFTDGVNWTFWNKVRGTFLYFLTRLQVARPRVLWLPSLFCVSQETSELRDSLRSLKLRIEHLTPLTSRPRSWPSKPRARGSEGFDYLLYKLPVWLMVKGIHQAPTSRNAPQVI